MDFFLGTVGYILLMSEYILYSGHVSCATLPNKWASNNSFKRSDEIGTGIDEIPCGFPAEVCMCKGFLANCSGYYGKHTFIPLFSETIYTLDFRSNSLKSIPNDDFFINVTQLKTLDLSDNEISYLSPSVFKPLTHLHVLYFDNNTLNYSSMEVIFRIPELRSLSLISSNLGILPDNFFVKQLMPKLVKLCLNMNDMSKLNMTLFQPLRSLQDLQLDGNKLIEFTSARMPTLRRLSLNFNRLFDFPVTCRLGKSFFPKLKSLFLINNYISKIHNLTCLPKLKLLNLKFNRIPRFDSGFFSERYFPTLSALYLTQMECKIRLVEANAFAHRKLNALYFNNNGLNFSSETVHTNMFANCPNLQILQLDGNYFAGISRAKLASLLSPMKASLRRLYLGNNYLQVFGSETFKTLPLLEEVYLYRNVLSSVPDGSFDGLENLVTIALDKNEISLVTQTTFSLATRSRLRQLNLGLNAFDCGCPLFWFRQWVLSNKTLFNYTTTAYVCQGRRMDFDEFFVSDQMCLLSHDTYVLTVVSVGVLIFTLTLSVFLFRYRWQIRLVMYEAFRANPKAKWRHRKADDFEYDLFVSYSSEDVQWVVEYLIPEVEGRMHLRLCVHQRDFLAGKNITDNIVQSLVASKRVLVLLSPNFVRSQWCQFELEMCLQHVVENDDVMIVVLLRDVEARDMTATVIALLKITTYIQWGDETEARKSFWGRLKLALNDILSGDV